MIIPVLPQTVYNYSYLASGATEDMIVADNVPISNARTVSLSVRIHHLTLDTGASFRFLIYGVDPSRADGTVFVTSASIGDTGTITSSTPNLVGLATIITDPIYPFIRVVMQAKGPTGTGRTYAELSADLVVRQVDEKSQAAFAEDLLRAIYDEAPQSNGTLSQFTPGPRASGGCVTGLTYCSLTISCPPPTPKPPGEPTPPTESFICTIRDAISRVTLCK